jgi:hypothetical protein
MTTLESHSKEKNFPFRYFTDSSGKVVPLVAVTSFFRDDAAKKKYEEYVKNGIPIIGITAYKSFPKPIKDGSADDYTGDQKFDYTGEIRDWLCCFSDPAEYGFTATNNLIEMSESDFYDADPDDTPPTKKKYDVRTNCGLEEKYGKRIETVDFLPFHEFQQKLRESKILFVPNVADASPRVVAEAMIKDIPVLMNKNIMGGFKYIVDETGEFFTDETDAPDAIERMLNSEKTPRKWWRNNYSVKSSSVKLHKFVADAYPGRFDDVTEIKFIL